MALKGQPISIGTSDTTIYTVPSTLESSVHGLVFSNSTGSAVTVTLKVFAVALGGSAVTVISGQSVAAYTSYTWPKPININAGDYIQASASAANAIVALYSVFENSATPVATGFSTKGTWSSAITYVANDVVSVSGTSYVARQTSINQNPTAATPSTPTASWMVLTSKGDAGEVSSSSNSSVDNAVTRFDSTTGKVIQNSLVTISDTGAIVAPEAGSVIPFYFPNQASFPSAATYHGAIAHSHSDGGMFFAHGGSWVRLLQSGVTVTVADGGTGQTSLTANNVIIGNGSSAVNFVAPSTSGNVLTSNGTTWTSAALPAGGLTYVYKTANHTTQDKEGVLTNTSGGAFTVTLPATPATGAQVVIADAGAFWGTNNLTVGRNGSTIGDLAQDLVCDITGASVQLVYDGTTWEVYAQVGGNGGNAVTLAGVQTLTNKTIAFGSNTLTNVLSDNTVQTVTGTKSFAGTTSTLGAVLIDTAEVATILATAATGTINYDVTTQSVLYYTSNASANWTVNFRGSSGTSLNTLMSTGQSLTVAFLVTQGATAYYNNVVQVDGSAVTPKYQGGTAPTAGNASSVDSYVYTIVKTGSAAFTVFAAQTRFA